MVELRPRSPLFQYPKGTFRTPLDLQAVRKVPNGKKHPPLTVFGRGLSFLAAALAGKALRESFTQSPVLKGSKRLRQGRSVVERGQVHVPLGPEADYII